MHDAWAHYDTYLDVDLQLCWATQAADALVAMQQLAAQTTTTGTVDADALDKQI